MSHTNLGPRWTEEELDIFIDRKDSIGNHLSSRKGWAAEKAALCFRRRRFPEEWGPPAGRCAKDPERKGLRPQHRQPLRGLPADVRHHHPRAHDRCHRRAHEVLGHHDLQRRMDVRGLFPRRPHAVGRRWLDERAVERQGFDQGH